MSAKRQLAGKDLACIILNSKIKNEDKNVSFTALLDSGANTCLISEKVVKSLNLADQLKDEKVSIAAF